LRGYRLLCAGSPETIAGGRTRRDPTPLIGRGERVLRVTTKLMADSRRRARGRGKSDSIDAIAVARAGYAKAWTPCRRHQLEGPELDLRLLVDHRERLVRQRVALNNTLQWHLHDIWPELRLPGGSLFYGNWGPRVARRLARAADNAHPHRP
jgi:transposase